MSVLAFPQVQASPMFDNLNLLGRRAVKLVLTVATVFAMVLGLSLTSSAGTANAATGDSAPVHFGLGRAYWGENGMEIRLTREGTELAYLASTVGGGAGIKGTQLGAEALAKFGPIMSHIIRSGGIDPTKDGVKVVGAVAGATGLWAAEKVMIPDGMCLGITWAPEIVAPSSYISYPSNPHQSASWLESCS